MLELVSRYATRAIANHSIRSYLFARLAAEERGFRAERDYEPQLLFCACALHDIGLSEACNRGQRFEVDGADLAAEVLKRHGITAPEVDLVWQAIALNSSPGIVERRGTLCALTLAGVSIDFGVNTEFISNATAAAIHRAYPRLSIGRALTDAIVDQAREVPAKMPLFSMPAQTVRQRSSPPHLSEIERIATTSRWGE